MKPYYQDDFATIYHGDCREILPSLQHIDLILTDPPYGVGLEYASYDDSEANWFLLMDAVFPALRAAADMVIMPCCAIKRLAWIYAHHPPDWLIAWYKGSPGHRAYVGFNDWEPMLVYGKTRKLQMHDHFTVANTERKGKYGHPCPKPIKWAVWLISRACPTSGTLCDPFLGSGTTLRAAKDLSRKSIGIEIEEKYCEIAANRLAQEVLW